LLVGSWKQIDSTDGEAVWSFDKDGTFRYENPREVTYYVKNCDGTASGVWSLSDGDLFLTIKISQNNSQYGTDYFEATREILSLSDNQLSFMDINGSNAGTTFLFSRTSYHAPQKETVLPAAIKYGVYLRKSDLFDINDKQINGRMDAQGLLDDIKALKAMGLNYSKKENTLKTFYGLNLDKEIWWSNASVLIVAEKSVRLGTVAGYSNYSGTKTIFDSGLSRSMKEIVGTIKYGMDRLQIVDKDTHEYSYSVNGTQIKVSDQNYSKFNYNSQKYIYVDAFSGEEYWSCGFE